MESLSDPMAAAARLAANIQQASTYIAKLQQHQYSLPEIQCHPLSSDGSRWDLKLPWKDETTGVVIVMSLFEELPRELCFRLLQLLQVHRAFLAPELDPPTEALSAQSAAYKMIILPETQLRKWLLLQSRPDHSNDTQLYQSVELKHRVLLNREFHEKHLADTKNDANVWSFFFIKVGPSVTPKDVRLVFPTRGESSHPESPKCVASYFS